MKHIEKKSAPSFFLQDTNGLANWRQYRTRKKRKLKKFILEEEQYYLCCYCEKKISLLKAHIEHIKPKSIDSLQLTFDYNNLLVSCEGNHFNEIGDSSKNTCGHIKDNYFDEVQFLDPTLFVDIVEYFEFDSDTGEINPSLKDNAKARYTIDVLNLNGKNNRLAEARLNSKKSLINTLISQPLDQQEQHLKMYLEDNGSEFITFFRYAFKNINL